jgi:hypothetical protein
MKSIFKQYFYNIFIFLENFNFKNNFMIKKKLFIFYLKNEQFLR